MVFSAKLIQQYRDSPFDLLNHVHWIYALAFSLLLAGFYTALSNFAEDIPGPEYAALAGNLSSEESISSAERQVAVRADVLTRQFENRIQKEVDEAVKRLSSTADMLIKSELAERIDNKIGTDIVSVLGEKLSAQTEETSKIMSLRQEVSDRFVQMRSRSLEYASASQRQATSFRQIGIALALAGILVVGFVFVSTYAQYQNHPELLERHYDWSSLLSRQGTSYAFAALCEFLALIMFRYQSKSLEYMRYFSNEANNLDARHVAYVSAIHFSDKTKMNKLIERLDATERNFIIGKDQRTLEMANNENEDRLLSRIRSMLERSPPKDKGDR